MITIEIKDDQITAALDGLVAHLGDMTQVMRAIGELLQDSTNQRFQRSEAPDGSTWAAKSPVTRGDDRRPLYGPSGILNTTIALDLGPDHLELGTNTPYGAMMQFGGSKEAFPHLWGDIPARPFLGISEDDRSGILETAEEWLARSAQGGTPGD